MEFHIKKSRFIVRPQYKESKCSDRGHSLNRDFSVLIQFYDKSLWPNGYSFLQTTLRLYCTQIHCSWVIEELLLLFHGYICMHNNLPVSVISGFNVIALCFSFHCLKQVEVVTLTTLCIFDKGKEAKSKKKDEC